MRPTPLLRLVGGLLGLVVLLGVAGCSGGDGDAGAGPGDRPAGGGASPRAEGEDGGEDGGEGGEEGGEDGGHEGGHDAPTPDPRPEAKVVCQPFTEMVEALDRVDYRKADPDQVVAEMAPVMKKWAARMPDLERPPGMAAETWATLELLSRRVLELPDDPTAEQFAAVEQGLTAQQGEQIDAAAEWYQEHCGLP